MNPDQPCVAHSTAVFADGLEKVGDLFGSGLVLYALFVASKPPDKEHPYGHGRSETIAALAVGFLLAASGLGICYESIRRLRAATEIPPQMTVQASHDLATAIRFLIREKLDWVADVVVHVEPFSGNPNPSDWEHR